MYDWLEIIEGKTGYWIIGYIKVFGGPFNTDIDAQKYRHYLKEKWEKEDGI